MTGAVNGFTDGIQKGDILGAGIRTITGAVRGGTSGVTNGLAGGFLGGLGDVMNSS